MLRVKVFEVDENGAEKPFLDNEGNPIVRESEGMVMATQTAKRVDDRLETTGDMLVIGEINPLAMGTLLKRDKMIRKFMAKAMLFETMNALLRVDEEETEE